MPRDPIRVPLVPECAPCITHSLKMLIPLLTSDPDLQFRMFRRAFEYLAKGFDEGIAPHPLSVDMYQELYSMGDVDDPFREIKRKSNEVAMSLLPQVEELISSLTGYERLRACLGASIAGNLIDYNTAAHRPDLETLYQDFERILEDGFAIDHSRRLWEELTREPREDRRLVFLADNAGETIFDIPLLRLLNSLGWSVTYVVKGGPMANDATREDVAGTEIEQLAEISDTGVQSHGVPPDLVSSEFLVTVRSADLVVSKGQSNIETFPRIQDQIGVLTFYVLRAKCANIAGAIGARPGDNVVLAVEGG